MLSPPPPVFRCQARECRWPDTHVTAGHRCGLCGRHGHGQIECRDTAARADLLRRTAGDRVAVACAVDTCSYAWTHTTAGHRCAHCRRHGGGGCHACALRIPDSRTEASSSSDEELRAPGTLDVTCPHCKCLNIAVDVGCTVYTSAECSLCMEASPCVVLPTCRHANVCPTCVARLR